MPLSLAPLLSAFACLLTRHALLRTTLHLAALTTRPLPDPRSPPSPFFQLVHPPHTFPVSRLYHVLPTVGPRETCHARPSAGRGGGSKHGRAPPVRLLVGPRQHAKGHVVVLALPRLLADRYTLRRLHAELLALYAARLLHRR